MDLPERIKIARESIGISQKDMAKALGSSLPSIQNYESGKSVPGGDVIKAFVKLGFNANWLLTGEGEMKRESASVSDSVPGFTPDANHPKSKSWKPPETAQEAIERADQSQRDLDAGIEFFVQLMRRQLEGKAPEEIADLISEMRDMVRKKQQSPE